MYWLVGSLVIVVMLGTLTVAVQVVLPDVSWLSHHTSADGLVIPFLLLGIAALLIWLSQRNALIPTTCAIARDGQRLRDFFIKWLRYVILIVSVLALMVLSMLQVISRYQQLEASAITDTARVQAWVTIEGISDSVYDPATGNGYRQVATLHHIQPLTTELSQTSLATLNSDHLISKTLTYDQTSAGSRSPVRVLLTAYPKSSTAATSATDHSNSATDDAFMALNQLRPDDQLLMQLTLAPLSTSEDMINSPTGFDSYRWLRARHLDGTANIIAVGAPEAAESLTPVAGSVLERLRHHIDLRRWQLRHYFYQDWLRQTTAEQQASAVTLSLLTGDRSLINRATKDLYQLAGISHLLAISGTHVLFLAIILAGVATWLCNRFWPTLYRYVPRWQVRFWVMIGSALIYALFTGFDVPAARTAWTLLAVGIVRFTLLPISTLRVLLALAIIMAWFDPYVLWQAGYWLSFIAVALLLQYEAAEPHQAHAVDDGTHKTKASVMYRRGWLLFKRVFKLQCWLFIALLPVTLLLFNKVSLWGLVINLFAIGLFGWVIVPMNLLAGLCYWVAPVFADGIWALVSAIIGALHELIGELTHISVADAWLYTPVNTAMLIVAALVMLPWLLPQGLMSRVLALPPLTLLVMSVYANQQALLRLPSLYVLPTGDRYVSASLLSYPASNNESAQEDVYWLFLADHRAPDKNRPSSLSAEQLSGTIEQQLRSLSIKRLDGIIVQSGATSLLPMTVVQLSQNLPTHHYWQARRRSDQAVVSTSVPAQPCQQGRIWQADGGGLRLEALTGWDEIDDESAWGCGLAIDSAQPLTVVRYNAADPHRSVPSSAQVLPTDDSGHLPQNPSASRLILDAAVHSRTWQLWALLCEAQPLGADPKATTWLGYSTAPVTPEILTDQRVTRVLTYDDKPLTAALALADNP